MISVCSLLSTLMLFSELSSRLVTVAFPVKLDESLAEPDALGSLLEDETMPEPAAVPRVWLDSLRDEDGSSKVIVSDAWLKGRGVRGPTSAFARGQRWRHSPAEYSVKVGRRDVDLDMLRCMIGRVYRPCWQV